MGCELPDVSAGRCSGSVWCGSQASGAAPERIDVAITRRLRGRQPRSAAEANVRILERSQCRLLALLGSRPPGLMLRRSERCERPERVMGWTPPDGIQVPK